MPLHILINGYKGRMGQAINAAAPGAGVEIVRRLDAGDLLEAACFVGVDVAVDFSSHDAGAPLARLAAARKVPLVIGTTGHTPAERKEITAQAKKIPIVWAGNYSVGVNLLNFLVRRAADVLGPRYNIEVVEMHHRDKKDAPSGTAEKLVEIVREARRLAEDKVVHGRHGLVGARPEEQIGVHALRGGDVVGDHTVIFAGDGERIELMHKASSRAIFAAGALQAAKWVKGQKPGLYGMDDVLGLKI
ncbi:MAG TPA: 4-hydroxy-tetrahydrodipicolinate reductase [Opitutales bacterium]|nr:4-hydroxy-tetrahydrodipicolinate reductase [Opitutales bacterium]